MMRYIYIILSLCLISCIDSINLEQDVESNILVVEGGITTEFGPHSISLSRGARYGSVFKGVITQEQGASLFIRDEFGETVRLDEIGNGIYNTPSSFKGKIGISYILVIRTRDGVEYQSQPEKINEVPDIDEVSIEYVDIPIVEEELGNSSIPGVEVYITYKDQIEISNYYRWKTRGTYRLETRPDLYTPPRSRNPVPKECCEICYTNEVNNTISVSSDRLYNGNSFKNKIVFIEDDGLRFSDKYIIEINQTSISREAYRFYDLLNSQLSIQGDIFDPPPATIRGNIIGLSNPDEDVVGFFTASDIRTLEYDIRGEDLPRVQPIPIIPDDCRVVPNSSITIPDNWF